MMRLRYPALVVRDYDEAISFFVDVLGFELLEDAPARTSAGDRAKRWVVVGPPGGETGVLLARADSPEQEAVVGRQAAGRVAFFLEVDDVEAEFRRMRAAGVVFESVPRRERYGTVAVFLDVAGNRWDLLSA